MAFDHSSILIEHLNLRREHCRILLNLSRRQRDLITEGHYEELIELVERKQHVLTRLDELKRVQPAGLQNWTSHRSTLPHDVRESCETVLQQTEQILAELIAEEEICANQLIQRHDATRQQLADIANGRDVHGAYGNTAEGPAHRFLDIHQ